MRGMDELLFELQRLEVTLHHPGVPLEDERLQAVLHAGFHEVGRSGFPYDRPTVLRFLAEQGQGHKALADVVSDTFAVRSLSPTAALLTYRSALRQPDGTLTRHTLRSSVWVKEGGAWQLLYHQGTPAGTAW
jgi:hypothetical protein